jgi:hypothetical protein
VNVVAASNLLHPSPVRARINARSNSARPASTKNERNNIDDHEIAAFKLLAAQVLAYDEGALVKAIAAGVVMEVKCEDQTKS